MRVLVIHAHPRPSSSVLQKGLRLAAEQVKGITFHDLYAAYPDFGIDVAHEQSLLEAHDLIVLQHPLYWYSTPAILKEWQDQVLELGWAYGTGGTRLSGKFLMQAISTGSMEEHYRDDALHLHSLHDFLLPIRQLAHLCNMAYLRPYILYGGLKLDAEERAANFQRYRDLLQGYSSGQITALEQVQPGYRLPKGFQSRS